MCIRDRYNTVNLKTISIFGWSFKKDTNDSRESASIYIASKLLDEGANIMVYDPAVSSNSVNNDLRYLYESKNYTDHEILEILTRVKLTNNEIDAVKNSSAIAIATEWDVIKSFNYKKMFKIMKKPAYIFDGRKILNKEKLDKIGFKTFEIGKK